MKPIKNSSLTAEFSLVKENILIQNERITQVYVIQSESDPFIWFGVLFVDSGLYMGAVIRFTMFVDQNYPHSGCPKITFDPVPYHPLVDPDTGQLDTKNAFPNWNSNDHRFFQLLLFVKRVICQAQEYIEQIQEIVSEDMTSNAYENAAGQECQSQSTSKETRLQGSKSDMFEDYDKTLQIIKTYQDRPEEIKQIIDKFKERCYSSIFDRTSDDQNFIGFTPWNPAMHEPLRDLVLAGRFKPTNLFASYHKETDSVTFVPGSDPLH